MFQLTLGLVPLVSEWAVQRPGTALILFSWPPKEMKVETTISHILLKLKLPFKMVVADKKFTKWQGIAVSAAFHSFLATNIIALNVLCFFATFFLLYFNYLIYRPDILKIKTYTWSEMFHFQNYENKPFLHYIHCLCKFHLGAIAFIT